MPAQRQLALAGLRERLPARAADHDCATFRTRTPLPAHATSRARHFPYAHATRSDTVFHTPMHMAVHGRFRSVRSPAAARRSGRWARAGEPERLVGRGHRRFGHFHAASTAADRGTPCRLLLSLHSCFYCTADSASDPCRGRHRLRVASRRWTAETGVRDLWPDKSSRPRGFRITRSGHRRARGQDVGRGGRWWSIISSGSSHGGEFRRSLDARAG